MTLNSLHFDYTMVRNAYTIAPFIRPIAIALSAVNQSSYCMAHMYWKCATR